ncbi:uncharacterized protein LOC131667902 [Phymastichus coffea]|uniref:uncharacterized protein LOC131667902 n=1 Tax=Phymastichus coffea TaxID=108790 RepID=UPI00273A79B4|nr:uncharacterized protein LOC131667902 [Phymastichus coffea]
MTLETNGHVFTENDRRGENHDLGAVIYLFCSLFNHSCNPNVTRIPVMENGNKPQQMILAVHPIEKGSQIFDDYGFGYGSESLSRRKDLCRHYKFLCKCKACENDWPLHQNLKSNF